MTATERAADWRRLAKCKGVPTNIFYPEDNGFTVGSRDWEEECAAVARRYCNRCPVRSACAKEVESHGDASRGVWAGQHFIARRESTT